MQTIQIDSDVFAILQKNAQPFIDTPNSTLRRLLGVDLAIASTEMKENQGDLSLEQLRKDSMDRVRSKAPKAELGKLVSAGLLKDGELLLLVDYANKIVPECEAKISGASLVFRGKSYSMSKLAQELLQKIGYKANDVRGPSHWVTARGDSITGLWEKHQRKVASGI